MRKLEKKNWIKIGATLALFVLMVVLGYKIAYIEPEVSYTIKSNNISNNTVVGEIVSGVKVEQKIEGIGSFCGVQILLATYGIPNLDANYTIQITNNSGEVLTQRNFNARDIADNSYFKIVLDEEYNFENEQLSIVIFSDDAVSGNALTIWKSDEDTYEQGNLYIANQQVAGDIVFEYITECKIDNHAGIIAYRVLTIFILFLFVVMHIWIPVKKMYDFIFKYRLLITIGIFCVLVFNKIHYSSIGMFDTYIQPGLGSGYDRPIWGEARSIRSDEWLVSTPKMLTSAFLVNDEKSYIVMAKEMEKFTANTIQFGWASLAMPYTWGYLSGNAEIGLSFQWNFMLIFLIYFSFEMFLILSNGNRLISVLGGTLVGASSYCLWWSGNIYLLSGQAACVCLYYAVNQETKWKRILFGIGTAIFGACFAIQSYPAWQVPLGYVFLLILVILIIKSWNKIREFDKIDWTIVICCIFFMMSMIIAYFFSASEYTTSILDTVYPGHRECTGGYAIDKLFNYVGSWLFAVKEVSNPSETSIIVNLFPLPMILGGYYMIKTKHWDGLIGGLMAISLFFVSYCTIGIPKWLAKITLMSYSTESRTVDILAVVQLYLFIVVVARMGEPERWNRITALLVTLVMSLVTVSQFEKNIPEYFNFWQLLAVAVVLTLCFYPWLAKKSEKLRLIPTVVVIIITLWTGSMVHPVMKGLDVIYTKPAAKEIANIIENDKTQKWITLDSIVTSGFTIACGAPTINSTNFIPNYELWDILDKEKKYEECWNRYAHMVVTLTEDETSVSLIQQDAINLNLSYDDLERIDVRYIYAQKEIPSTQDVQLEEIYNEAGSYIYKVNYKTN